MVYRLVSKTNDHNGHEGSSPSRGTRHSLNSAAVRYRLVPDTLYMKTLNQLRDETNRITQAMPGVEKWTIHNRLVELMEEVGELANAIQTDEGFKTKKRKKSEVVDSVCDVMFELLNIAAYYKVDLDHEYPQVLKYIDERRKSGEFDH